MVSIFVCRFADSPDNTEAARRPVSSDSSLQLAYGATAQLPDGQLPRT
jgi:hypothetical protein